MLDHLRAAFYHLRDKVGLGSHQLIKLGDGDWDDGIALVDPSPTAYAFTIAEGESIPNSQVHLVTPISKTDGHCSSAYHCSNHTIC